MTPRRASDDAHLKGREPYFRYAWLVFDQSKESIYAGKDMRVSDRMVNRLKTHSEDWEERQ